MANGRNLFVGVTDELSVNTPTEIELTRKEAQALIDRQAQAVLGVSAERAFEMIDRGELNGTIIQAELSNLRWLLSRLTGDEIPRGVRGELARIQARHAWDGWTQKDIDQEFSSMPSLPVDPGSKSSR